MNKAQLKIIAAKRKAKEREKIKAEKLEAAKAREFQRVKERLARSERPEATAEAIEAFSDQPLTPEHQRWAEMTISDEQLEEAIVSFQKRLKDKHAYVPKKLAVRAYQEGYLTNGQFAVLMKMPSSYIIRSVKLLRIHASCYYQAVKYVRHLTGT